MRPQFRSSRLLFFPLVIIAVPILVPCCTAVLQFPSSLAPADDITYHMLPLGEKINALCCGTSVTANQYDGQLVSNMLALFLKWSFVCLSLHDLVCHHHRLSRRVEAVTVGYTVTFARVGVSQHQMRWRIQLTAFLALCQAHLHAVLGMLLAVNFDAPGAVTRNLAVNSPIITKSDILRKLSLN